MHETATKYLTCNQLARITAYAKEHYYTQKPNYYHNWNHVERMLNMLSEIVEEKRLVKMSPKMYTCLYVAIVYHDAALVYHDAAYIPGIDCNEETAMELVENLWANEHVSECGIDKSLMREIGKCASYLIESTKSHKEATTNIKYLDNQAVALLHDLDYMGFATDYKQAGATLILTNEIALQNEWFDSLQKEITNEDRRKFCLNRKLFCEDLMLRVEQDNKLYMLDCFSDLNLTAYITLKRLCEYYTDRLEYLGGLQPHIVIEQQ